MAIPSGGKRNFCNFANAYVENLIASMQQLCLGEIIESLYMNEVMHAITSTSYSRFEWQIF